MPPRKPTHQEKVVLELSSIKASINNLSTNMGKYLSVIAKAVSTPTDNSAEVQAMIDKVTADINASTDVVEDAIKTTNQPKES